jgi:hypothetical protein
MGTPAFATGPIGREGKTLESDETFIGYKDGGPNNREQGLGPARASHPAWSVKIASLQTSAECQSTEPVDNPVHKPPAWSRNLAGFFYSCRIA